MKKSKRALIAKNTLEILRRGYYKNQNGKQVTIAKAQKEAEKGTILYKPDDLLELIESIDLEQTGADTEFVVNGLTSLDSVRNEYHSEENLVCLNFASARNPGGGFLNGSQAQEESIARATGLYPCQLKAEGYYLSNRKIRTCLYTDHIIYSPKVPVIKNEAGDLLDQPVFASIITAPAVNTGVVLRNEPDNIPEIEPVMKRRMDMVLAICKKHQYQTLILGAWGCGVFRNDPEVIAVMFKDLLFGKYKNQFKKVVFSVYAKDERFINPFKKAFDTI